MTLTSALKGPLYWLILAPLWAIPSPEMIATATVETDDPLQINAQILATMRLSFRNLYPDLMLINSIPVADDSTHRLLNPGAEIIPHLSPSLFTKDDISRFQHIDEITVK
jgi:hypothetical protein